MSLIEIHRYEDSMEQSWNLFINESKNATFLFNRGYMNYHSDRFLDSSYIFIKKDKIIAAIPGVIQDAIYKSHPGLTYGGLIQHTNVTLQDVSNIFELLNIELKRLNIKSCIYKPVPYIYHLYPSQEDLYLLFKLNAQIIGRNISSTIKLENRLSFIESRKSGIRKSIKNNVSIQQSIDYNKFWEILQKNLLSQHGVAPVHTLNEIKLLHERFTQNIKLYGAFQEAEMIAGCVLFDMKDIVHVQYISANEMGKNVGALDLLFSEIISNEYANRTWFDFGQSTEQNGNYLNENLIFQKEGFGGRGIVYDIYEYKV